MADIKPFILNNLLEPLKQYHTVIQDTMIEIIAQKLQNLYDYTVQFPEIVSPNQGRLDILKAIADQFLFTIREEADIQEQIDILDNILYIYNKRGSIDTIENMWKYYGGDLPKDVKVVIPSYNLFRYSISKLSGTHVFQDNTINRTGVYEIRLTNNTYPIPELKEFLIKELVAAGNYIYFTNTLHADITETEEYSEPYKYLIYEDTFIDIQMEVLKSQQGLTWSGKNPLSPNPEFTSDDINTMIQNGLTMSDIEKLTKPRDHYESLWSGRGSIFLELSKMTDLPLVAMNTYQSYLQDGINISIIASIGGIEYTETEEGNGKSLLTSITSALYKEWNIKSTYRTEVNSFLYCTPTDSSFHLARYLYDRQGNLISSKYPGYFVLGETLLGEEVI